MTDHVWFEVPDIAMPIGAFLGFSQRFLLLMLFFKAFSLICIEFILLMLFLKAPWGLPTWFEFYRKDLNPSVPTLASANHYLVFGDGELYLRYRASVLWYIRRRRRRRMCRDRWQQ